MAVLAAPFLNGEIVLLEPYADYRHALTRSAFSRVNRNKLNLERVWTSFLSVDDGSVVAVKSFESECLEERVEVDDAVIKLNVFAEGTVAFEEIFDNVDDTRYCEYVLSGECTGGDREMLVDDVVGVSRWEVGNINDTEDS